MMCQVSFLAYCILCITELVNPEVNILLYTDQKYIHLKSIQYTNEINIYIITINRNEKNNTFTIKGSILLKAKPLEHPRQEQDYKH